MVLRSSALGVGEDGLMRSLTELKKNARSTQRRMQGTYFGCPTLFIVTGIRALREKIVAFFCFVFFFLICMNLISDQTGSGRHHVQRIC